MHISQHLLEYRVDPGRMPGSHQSCSIMAFLSWTGKTKYNTRVVGKDKEREKSLTCHCHRQNMNQLGKISLLLIKTEYNNEK